MELKHHELSTELVAQMGTHSKFMYMCYKKMKELLQTGTDDWESFKPLAVRAREPPLVRG